MQIFKVKITKPGEDQGIYMPVIASNRENALKRAREEYASLKNLEVSVVGTLADGHSYNEN